MSVINKNVILSIVWKWKRISLLQSLSELGDRIGIRLNAVKEQNQREREEGEKKKKMTMAVMRQGPLSLSPYPQFLCGTPQTTPKAQFHRQVCLAVSSQEEEDREGNVKKKMSKNNIAQRLASVHFKVFFRA